MPMKRKTSILRGQTGFSLLEVLITALILSVGLLGLAGLQIAGMKTTHNSYQSQQATWLVHDLLERMRANRAGVVAGNYNINPPFGACGSAPVCANTADCQANETAAIDLYQVYCGSGGNSGGINNELSNGQLRVSCPSGCSAGQVAIRLQWDERNASRNAGADVEQFNIQLNAIL